MHVCFSLTYFTSLLHLVARIIHIRPRLRRSTPRGSMGCGHQENQSKVFHLGEQNRTSKKARLLTGGEGYLGIWIKAIEDKKLPRIHILYIQKSDFLIIILTHAGLTYDRRHTDSELSCVFTIFTESFVPVSIALILAGHK